MWKNGPQVGAWPTLCSTIYIILILQGGDCRPPVPRVGDRWEPFFDDALIAAASHAVLRLHPPLAREVVLVFDAPWEGSTSGYVTVIRDADRYRMYYRGGDFDPRTGTYSTERTCYAESRDGKSWQRPNLGLIAFEGSVENNLVWDGTGTHNFTPFRDTNPACPPDRRYKAFASGDGGLLAFASADGLRWRLCRETPVITEGAFDSQNLAFWDGVRGRYVEYHRGLRDEIRDILSATSADFLHWSQPVWLDYGSAPAEHLYTNAILPCPGAEHVFVGLPMRFLPERRVGTHPIAGVSDGLFMSSRDGVRWRRWGEAFLRPGRQPERWINRNNMIAWGLVATAADLPGVSEEWSLYSGEGYYTAANRLRRFALRPFGFVSLHAGLEGGEAVTVPFVVDGRVPTVNYATSAAGSLRVEVQDESGRPVKGFALEDSPELYGDAVAQPVAWTSGADPATLRGKTICLRFVLRDGDLFAFRFAP